MINLLPPQVKSDFAYAKRNSLVVRFVIVMIVVALALSLLMAGGVLYANAGAERLEKQLGNRKQQVSELNEARQEAASISATVDTIENLLDQQSYYSHFIAELGQTTPNWAAVRAVTLERTQNGQPDPNGGKRVDLQVILEDISRVSELRTILLSMERVDFVDIQQAQDSDTTVNTLIVLGLNTPAHEPLKPGDNQ